MISIMTRPSTANHLTRPKKRGRGRKNIGGNYGTRKPSHDDNNSMTKHDRPPFFSPLFSPQQMYLLIDRQSRRRREVETLVKKQHLSRRDQWLAPLLLFDYLKSDSDPLTKSALKGASSPLSSRLVRSDRPRASFVRNTSGQGSSFILRGSMNRIDFTALPLVPRRPRNAGGRGGRINCPNGGTEILESRVCVYMYVCVY